MTRVRAVISFDPVDKLTVYRCVDVQTEEGRRCHQSSIVTNIIYQINDSTVHLAGRMSEASTDLFEREISFGQSRIKRTCHLAKQIARPSWTGDKDTVDLSTCVSGAMLPREKQLTFGISVPSVNS